MINLVYVIIGTLCIFLYVSTTQQAIKNVQIQGGKSSTQQGTSRKQDVCSCIDDEVELLLHVANEYKVSKAPENVWESCQRYADILQLFKQQYTTKEEVQKLGKDYPHNVEELTKAIITTLKAIRIKLPQAVDRGKPIEHGRVVLLYFKLHGMGSISSNKYA